jgi:uncharacterized protein (TIGR02466 family)
MSQSIEVFPLFSTPVIKTSIEFDADINYLDSLEYYPYDGGSGYGSVNENILLEPHFDELRSQIENYLNVFLFEILKFNEGSIAHTRSWINLHKPKCYAPRHNHTNSCYSGVYYFDVPQNSGMIWFIKPNEIPTFASPTVLPTLELYNIYNSNEFGFETKKNDLLLFPSHLTHKVDANNSDKNRYSLAFNYFLEGRMGGKTGATTIKILQ